MAGPKATARSPALRWSVLASGLDLFLSALGALTWGLGRSPGPGGPMRFPKVSHCPNGTLLRSWRPAVLDLRPGM